MRVLFLTHRLPYAPDRGDRLRAYYVLRHLSRRMHVDVVSLVHSKDERRRAAQMADHGFSVRVCETSRLHAAGRGLQTMIAGQPLTHALLDSPSMRRTLEDIARRSRPDVVLAFCSGMARFAVEPPLDGIPFVLDLVDVDSEKWKELSERVSAPRRWIYRREARCLRAFEALAARRAVTTLVVNERERAALEAVAPGIRGYVVRNGIDVDHLRPSGPPADSADVVFCGVMNYGPNEAGARWMIRDVWPLIRRRRADSRLLIVGADPSRRLQAEGASDSRIIITGRVDDVRPYLWQAAVSIAPIHTARGVQNKVLEAVACGLPAVATPVVHAGLPAEVGRACTSAATAEEFAAAVLSLLSLSPSARREAANVPLDRLGWDTQLAPLDAVLSAAAGQSEYDVARAI